MQPDLLIQEASKSRQIWKQRQLMDVHAKELSLDLGQQSRTDPE
jgi:hypothetical protein